MNKFFKIYLELKEKIENKQYRSNSLLPSENDLAKEYGVSRETIRKALLLLLNPPKEAAITRSFPLPQRSNSTP